MEKFTVTLNHHAHYGYVEYDPETKTANVCAGCSGSQSKGRRIFKQTLNA